MRQKDAFLSNTLLFPSTIYDKHSRIIFHEKNLIKCELNKNLMLLFDECAFGTTRCCVLALYYIVMLYHGSGTKMLSN